MPRPFMLLLFCLGAYHLSAQNDPEFPKEFIMHLKLHNGMVTDFNSTSPDPYVGGIQLVPQYTLVVNKLRGGIIADMFYTGKKLQAAFGPTVSLKLKTMKAGPLGSAANIHLNFDYLFGTQKQRLIGGGINADVLNWFVVGLSAYRDYNLNNWWFQNTLGIRISKIKKKKGHFD